MALGDDQVAREPAVALQLTATPAAAAPECVRLFSLTGGPRMPTRMLTRQEAGGQVRLLVAASASTRRRQEPDLCRQSPASEGQLPGAAANSLSRPLPDIRSARSSARRRPVPKYSRHRPTAARRCSFPKADVHDLAALGGTRYKPYVRSSISRPGAADPLRAAIDPRGEARVYTRQRA